LFAIIPRRARKRRTVREALVECSWITDITGGVQLSAEPDRLVWRWTTNGQYTSKSCYNALFERALVSSSWRINWKS
jgi:hypothetical protein